MPDGRGVSGFEDFWGQFRNPMRLTPALLKSAAFRERLGRIAAGAAGPVVTFAGAPKSLAALRANLDYISRGGELPLIGRDGEVLLGRDELRARAEDWHLDRYGWHRDMNLAVSLVASMPPGVPHKPVFEAAADFAQGSFTKNAWLLARHDDEAHPHVHISVRAQSDDGLQFHPGPAEFRQMRERFAQNLRDHGIEAEAAPRWARGKAIKAQDRQVYLMERDFREGLGPEPHYAAKDAAEAFQIARGRDAFERPWEQRLKERHREVRKAYLSIAEALERLGSIEDRTLAGQLRGFVERMQPPLTRRELLVREAADLELRRNLGREVSRQRSLSR